MPRGTNAPKLCPAEPKQPTRMVSSGSPSPPHIRVTSEPSIVPIARSTLRTGRSIATGSRWTMALRQAAMSPRSKARSS